MALNWEWPRSEQLNIDADVFLAAPRPCLKGGIAKSDYSVRKGSKYLCPLSSPLQQNLLRFIVQHGIYTSQPFLGQNYVSSPGVPKSNPGVQMVSLSPVIYSSCNFFLNSVPFVFWAWIHWQDFGPGAHLVRSWIHRATTIRQVTLKCAPKHARNHDNFPASLMGWQKILPSLMSKSVQSIVLRHQIVSLHSLPFCAICSSPLK